MKILAVDTSCDETSAAVIEDGRILSNVISSQVDLHKKWGGVVPDIARRAHNENIENVVKEALKRARTDIEEIDFYTATYGPGLAIALEVGLKYIQNLAIENDKPFVPIDHMEGHLLSAFAQNSKGTIDSIPNPKKHLPAIGLLVSGGHTELILMKNFGEYELLGETLDDAAGEAFDKVAKMLNLGYPGGPVISEFAKLGVVKDGDERFGLPIPMENSNDLNFSYSGLKTACLYKIRDIEANNKKFGPQKKWIHDFCAEFVDVVIKSLILKLEAAVEEYEPKSILIGGGVISNVALRRAIRSAMRKHGIPVLQPYTERLFTDNAGMIGVAAYFGIKHGTIDVLRGKDILNVDRDPIAQVC